MPIKNNFLNSMLILLATTTISIAIILLCVKITLNFKPLYYFDVYKLSIEKTSKISNKEILENYDSIVVYLNDKTTDTITLPTLPITNEAKGHFRNVKELFTTLDNIMYICLILSPLLLYLLLKNRNYKVLKYSSYSLCTFTIILILLSAVNFDKTFTAFHEIFFKNDYWLFDTVADPVIRILPQDYFLHSTLFILLLINLFSLILILIFNKLCIKRAQVSN